MATPKYSASTSKVAPSTRATTTVHTAHTFLFDKQNYIYIFVGMGLILLGFILMTGGKSPDPNVFNKDIIYSPVRITLAPILILAGFIIEVYAIMKKPVSTTVVVKEEVVS